MKKRFVVKSVTKFVVFDTSNRKVASREYFNIPNADSLARKMNIDARSVEVFAKADADRAAEAAK